jgi:hypothetical protein
MLFMGCVLCFVMAAVILHSAVGIGLGEQMGDAPALSPSILGMAVINARE